ncbi:cupin domain-containing protein [Paenibacillus alginolyticus]|uniref:Acireductone dioxygenase n=1 Tax=Paenibacillus alginolyticus TaxID=59839 RepID=A0ABT4GFU1_9BACL|nr:cupin domain-containing protein [Paenibacillus alginolyticus]MCY9664221.1 cupin domain-containing protein [Paenibacillus alginolyticus]MCY9695048.1 cupin domain-containing protein [Paenibacillus alginolyticus]MEC0145460.1 cupin domain-containing protein [Paenibacillus alginolyticus]
MAQIRIRNTNERIEGEEQVKAFLDSQNVVYEHWDANKLPETLREKFILSDDEKAQIISTYEEEIRDLAARRGYEIWDVIALSDSTPNIEELLKKFEQVHTHTEDEIRAIVSGRGIFIIKSESEVGYFDVELEPGDVISVPENTNHFFTLMENREIVAVRLFIEKDGWVAYNIDDPEFIKA